jgi:hypothetical protein
MDIQYNWKNKKDKNGTQNTSQQKKKKRKIEHHKPYQKLILNSGFSGGYAASAPLVIPVMLLLKDTNII